MTTITLMRLPQEAPAAQGQPGLWRASLTVDGERIAEVIGGRELCLVAIGIKPPPEPRGAWLARGKIPVLMFGRARP